PVQCGGGVRVGVEKGLDGGSLVGRQLAQQEATQGGLVGRDHGGVSHELSRTPGVRMSPPNLSGIPDGLRRGRARLAALDGQRAVTCLRLMTWVKMRTLPSLAALDRLAGFAPPTLPILAAGQSIN